MDGRFWKAVKGKRTLVYLRENPRSGEHPAQLCIVLVDGNPDKAIVLPVNRNQLINMLEVGMGILRKTERNYDTD